MSFPVAPFSVSFLTQSTGEHQLEKPGSINPALSNPFTSALTASTCLCGIGYAFCLIGGLLPVAMRT
eukprot:1820910-Pleurochrysis_carterae.AAC.1